MVHYFSKVQSINVVLASASKQRSEILTQLRISHSVLPTHIKEHSSEVQPEKFVCDLAMQKARRGIQLYMSERIRRQASKENIKTTLVIGADTIVWLDDICYGKPRSKSHARRILRHLSGKRHQVYSGISMGILASDFTDTEVSKIHTCFDCCSVTFRCLTSQDIEYYLATDEWKGVAGSYAIQGISSCFIQNIDGLYSTVVGLPITVLCGMIEKIL